MISYRRAVLDRIAFVELAIAPAVKPTPQTLGSISDVFPGLFPRTANLDTISTQSRHNLAAISAQSPYNLGVFLGLFSRTATPADSPGGSGRVYPQNVT